VRPTAKRKEILRFIGANVRRLRMRQALSQEAFAERAGIAPRYLQDVEIGAVNLSVGVLVDLAAALGVEPRDLLRAATLPPAQVGRPRKRATDGSRRRNSP
jgi:transcriptional regulator with XRE-family HTH domain